jgi:hypothetical protein
MPALTALADTKTGQKTAEDAAAVRRRPFEAQRMSQLVNLF